MMKRRLFALLVSVLMMGQMLPLVASTAFADGMKTLISDPIGEMGADLADAALAGPVLSMEVRVDKARARSGDILTYTLAVSNGGAAAAKSVSVTDVLPDFVGNVGAFEVNGVPVDDPALNGTGFTLPVGDIAPAGLALVVFQATINYPRQVTDPIELINTASARENRQIVPGDGQVNAASPEASASTLLVAPDLEIAKSVAIAGGGAAEANQVKLNDLITYTLTVTNYRAEKSREIVVTDVLADRLDLLGWLGAGLRPSSGAATFDAVSRTITWTLPNGLDGAGNVWGTRSATLSFDVRPTQVGVYLNRASLTENGVEKASNVTQSTVIPATTPVPVTTVPVSKSWVGDSAAARPASVLVALLANGQHVPGKTLALSPPNWRGEFVDVPVYDAVTDLPIDYTVAELTDVAALGYETTVVGTAITNTLSTVDPVSYSLTIRYWNGELGGVKAAPDYQRTLLDGTVYNVASPNIKGYEPDAFRIVGVMEGEDVEYDIIYKLVDYTLTINYLYAATGEVAAPRHRETLNMGDEYNVKSKVIEGYTASKLRVTGTMPARDLIITVNYYAPEDEIIAVDDYGVPLGIGAVMMNLGDCFE